MVGELGFPPAEMSAKAGQGRGEIRSKGWETGILGAFNAELLSLGLSCALRVGSEPRAFAVDHAAGDHPSHVPGWVNSLLNDWPMGFFASHKGTNS